MKHLFSACLVLTLSIALNAQTPVTYTLPSLPYAYEALQPHIDSLTMYIHLNKHHQAYVTNLNNALEGSKFKELKLEELLLRASKTGDVIRNNAGGHYNHSLFWKLLTPNSTWDPNTALAKQIIKQFATVDSLKNVMNRAASTRFGSGWAWLYLTPEKKLAVCSSPNQDNPIMDAMTDRGLPIIGIDVWEHAYYLNYQNKRVDYLSAIWKLINWQEANRMYTEALTNPFMKEIERTGWTELKDLHKAMQQILPAAKGGNFEPLRAQAYVLKDLAIKLKDSKLPPSFKSPELEKILSEVTSSTEQLSSMVRNNASDAELSNKMSGLSDAMKKLQNIFNKE